MIRNDMEEALGGTIKILLGSKDVDFVLAIPKGKNEGFKFIKSGSQTIYCYDYNPLSGETGEYKDSFWSSKALAYFLREIQADGWNMEIFRRKK